MHAQKMQRKNGSCLLTNVCGRSEIAEVKLALRVSYLREYQKIPGRKLDIPHFQLSLQTETVEEPVEEEEAKEEKEETDDDEAAVEEEEEEKKPKTKKVSFLR